ncbi:acyl-ACP--UDP-N-acetylglucosamine O-acyltransferase [Solemya velesiana gill symbiont]|uniref:Acyl-[acyl-carrier-protein]--UDP-N-acetylglucosamine O-acyltransferase n=1 Tax=Solemya velesiana gill symbiont TaxID=1918948 RepID=A0A1T2KW85_9GAMM|nr:acyl-ACP--UDP-N-acetylglucosamine O-acyltransferase [Solemya velesiana gill symbiont]OOZ37084.1 acyl-[acyl-carrier-protein]--UDP-N-acetylglucosamine O-acyltransferase [Solemya velesiana gill symbiont]
MIHPCAIIDPKAELDESVKVGPFTVIGPGVQVGKGTDIGPHVVIKGETSIGEDNRIFQFASVGEDPQDKKYAGERTRLEIGDRNVIREFTTINRGTAQDAGVTQIGNDNLLMAYTHVAHDCRIGNHVIMANAASLGGHTVIDDWAILGGFTIAHQFSHIGAHSFCAMGSAVNKDMPPYVTVSGHPAKPHGINSEGLKRRDFSADAIAAIKEGYKLIYMRGLKLEEAREALDALARDFPEVSLYTDFLQKSDRGIVR